MAQLGHKIGQDSVFHHVFFSSFVRLSDNIEFRLGDCIEIAHRGASGSAFPRTKDIQYGYIEQIIGPECIIQDLASKQMGCNLKLPLEDIEIIARKIHTSIQLEAYRRETQIATSPDKVMSTLKPEQSPLTIISNEVFIGENSALVYADEIEAHTLIKFILFHDALEVNEAETQSEKFCRSIVIFKAESEPRYLPLSQPFPEDLGPRILKLLPIWDMISHMTPFTQKDVWKLRKDKNKNE